MIFYPNATLSVTNTWWVLLAFVSHNKFSERRNPSICAVDKVEPVALSSFSAHALACVCRDICPCTFMPQNVCAYMCARLVGLGRSRAVRKHRLMTLKRQNLHTHQLHNCCARSGFTVGIIAATDGWSGPIACPPVPDPPMRPITRYTLDINFDSRYLPFYYSLAKLNDKRFIFIIYHYSLPSFACPICESKVRCMKRPIYHVVSYPNNSAHKIDFRS